MIPRIAIIDQNTLEAAGLRGIIADIAPMADVAIFPAFEAMTAETQENTDETVTFVHYFVSAQVLIAHADYFLRRQRQTIVLTAQPIPGPQFSHLRTLSTAQPEHDLLRAILTLFQHAHGTASKVPLHPADDQGFRHHPPGLQPATPWAWTSTPPHPQAATLTARETEVLALVVRGLINKEIADRLCISLPTVVTHRKNICDKLHLRSVSSLTIYAVTHGIVPPDAI